MEAEFEIDIVPVPKGRPRFGKGKTYTPAKTLAFEREVARAASTALGGMMFEGAVSMEIEFHMPMPKTWSKKKRENPPPHLNTPDVDNLVKGVTDAMNKIAYKDDSQIVEIHAKKLYAEKNCIKIKIKTLT